MQRVAVGLLAKPPPPRFYDQLRAGQLCRTAVFKRALEPAYTEACWHHGAAHGRSNNINNNCNIDDDDDDDDDEDDDDNKELWNRLTLLSVRLCLNSSSSRRTTGGR